jgi:hypothetical protein
MPPRALKALPRQHFFRSHSVLREPYLETMCIFHQSQVDRSFIEDSFNLYGLKNMVNHYQSCMDLLLDRESECFGRSTNSKLGIK